MSEAFNSEGIYKEQRAIYMFTEFIKKISPNNDYVLAGLGDGDTKDIIDKKFHTDTWLIICDDFFGLKHLEKSVYRIDMKSVTDKWNRGFDTNFTISDSILNEKNPSLLPDIFGFYLKIEDKTCLFFAKYQDVKAIIDKSREINKSEEKKYHLVNLRELINNKFVFLRINNDLDVIYG